MADRFTSTTRRRPNSSESILLTIAVAIAVAAYWKFAPHSAGAWESAATQMGKKTPGPVLFYPAWERDVLRALPDTPLVMLDGPTHMDLAGLGHVNFASDTGRPEEAIDNLFTLIEMRDFAGKAVSILKTADHSLIADWNDLSVSVEDPPGIANCTRHGERFLCPDPDYQFKLENALFMRTTVRCLWVKSKPGRPYIVALNDLDKSPLHQMAVYLGLPDVTPDDVNATMPADVDVRIDDVAAGQMTSGPSGHWQKLRLQQAKAMSRVELSVQSPGGVCLDMELLP